ncbi:MAG TPA: septum formation initiator family protein [Actinomycetota bacterium]
MSVRSGVVGSPRAKLTGRAAILLVVVTVLGVLSLMPLRELLSERGRIVDLQRQAQGLEQANAELSAQIARLRSPAELERRARECLGMVESGEVAFVTTPRGGNAEPWDC